MSFFYEGFDQFGSCHPYPPHSRDLQFSCLELTHNHGSEDDAAFAVSSGNVEPYRGFGHIAVMTPDVYHNEKKRCIQSSFG